VSNDKVLDAARAHWELDDATFTLIAERENKVYRVDDAWLGQAALRLHRPGYRTTAEIESELLWMDMLAIHGLGVPRPIQGSHGSCIYSVDGIELSLLTWVDGTPLSRLPLTKELYFDLGCVLAQMHALADNWTLPAGFVRPTWDLVGSDPTWGRFWENPMLSSTQAKQLKAFCVDAQETMSTLAPLDFGLIHADLVPDNVLSTGSELQLIDFDDGGFGHRLFDIATITHRSRRLSSGNELAEAVVDGYSINRPLDKHALSLFEAMRACSYVGWNTPRMHEPKGLERNSRFIAEAEIAIEKYRHSTL